MPVDCPWRLADFSSEFGESRIGVNAAVTRCDQS
jgi:hypothetical protein